MKPEAAFAARVREGLQPLGVDIERIENRVNLGITDCLMGIDSTFVAVELKVAKRHLQTALHHLQLDGDKSRIDAHQAVRYAKVHPILDALDVHAQGLQTFAHTRSKSGFRFHRGPYL